MLNFFVALGFFTKFPKNGFSEVPYVAASNLIVIINLTQRGGGGHYGVSGGGGGIYNYMLIKITSFRDCDGSSLLQTNF